MAKESGQGLKDLENKNFFQVMKITFFIIFRGLSVAKGCLRPESASLRFS